MTIIITILILIIIMTISMTMATMLDLWKKKRKTDCDSKRYLCHEPSMLL